jgi:hypothetical protein
LLTYHQDIAIFAMNAEDVARVQRHTIKHLAEHSEQVSMPDDEFIPLISVVISAGALLLREDGVSERDIEKFTRDLKQEAKSAWLAFCAKLWSEDVNEAAELLLASKDFDQIFKEHLRRS